MIFITSLLLFLLLLLSYSNSNDISVNNSITPHWTLANITPSEFCIKHHNTIATRVPYAQAPCMLTHSPISDNDTIYTMQKKNFFYFNDWGCLFNADQPHHAVVKFNKMVTFSLLLLLLLLLSLIGLS
jgi:hypothetical protein